MALVSVRYRISTATIRLTDTPPTLVTAPKRGRGVNVNGWSVHKSWYLVSRTDICGQAAEKTCENGVFPHSLEQSNGQTTTKILMPFSKVYEPETGVTRIKSMSVDSINHRCHIRELCEPSCISDILDYPVAFHFPKLAQLN